MSTKRPKGAREREERMERKWEEARSTLNFLSPQKKQTNNIWDSQREKGPQTIE